MENEINITANHYFQLIYLFNYGKKDIEKWKFCEIIGISPNNTNTYNKVINILKYINVIAEDEFPKTRTSIKITIDRKKLKKFLLDSDFYKQSDDFIHKCLWGAYTP